MFLRRRGGTSHQRPKSRDFWVNGRVSIFQTFRSDFNSVLLQAISHLILMLVDLQVCSRSLYFRGQDILKKQLNEHEENPMSMENSTQHRVRRDGHGSRKFRDRNHW